MAQYIGPFGFASNFFDSADTALYGARTITTLTIGNRVFAYAGGSAAAGDFQGGITVLELNVLTAGLSHVETEFDNASTLLTAPRSLTPVAVGNSQFIIAAGKDDDAINVFKVTMSGDDIGQLTFVSAISDAALLNDVVDLSVLQVGSKTVIAAISPMNNSLVLYQLSAAGNLTQIEAVTDDASLPLFGVAGITDFRGPVWNNMLLTNGEDGVGLWRLQDDNQLVLLDSDASYSGAGRPFKQTELVDVGARTFVYTEVFSRTGVLAYEIVNDELVPITLAVKNGDTPSLDSFMAEGGLQTFEVDGETFLTARLTNAHLIFSIGANGTLTLVQELRADGIQQFLNGGAVTGTFVETLGRGFLLAPGFDAGFSYGISSVTISNDESFKFGTDGNDVMVFLGGDDAADGQGGSDRLYGGARHDDLEGGDGNDYLNGGDGTDNLFGEAGNDTLEGGSGQDDLYGGSGVDGVLYIDSGSGVTVWLDLSGAQTGGDAEGDILSSIENLGGSRHNDILRGSGIANLVSGHLGDDFIKGGGGTDTLLGGDGNDEILGDVAGDTLDGGLGDDIVRGGGGNDDIRGGGGDDLCLGEAGNDRLFGGGGRDALNGGAGADTFKLSADFASRDSISKFEVGLDRLEIVSTWFGGGLVDGALDPEQFVVNTTGNAEDADDRFILNSATGKLTYDSNGTGAGGSAVIVTFIGGIPALTAADFIIT